MYLTDFIINMLILIEIAFLPDDNIVSLLTLANGKKDPPAMWNELYLFDDVLEQSVLLVMRGA